MTTKYATVRTLALGALLAAGMSGCAWWHEHMGSGGSTAPSTATASNTSSDSAITTRVKDSFSKDEMVRSKVISVETQAGVVTLTGSVSNTAERDKAITLARNTRGVVDVKDNLKVTG